MRLRWRRRFISAIGLLALISSLFWVVPWNDLWAQSGYGSAPAAVNDFDGPTTSSPIAMDAAKNIIWVVSPDNDTVSAIGKLDTSSPTVINTIAVGHEPQAIAIDTNSGDPTKYHVYVATPADNGITIINVTASDASHVTAVVQKKLITGAEPWNVVSSPDGHRIFVANSGQDTITVIRTDGASPTIVGNVVLGSSLCNVGDKNRHFQPRGLAVTADNTRLYVTRFLSFVKDGGVQSDDNGKEGVVCELTIPDASHLNQLPAVANVVKLAPRETGFKDAAGNVTHAYPNQLQSVVIRGDNAYLPNIAASPSPPLKFNVDTQAFVNIVSHAGSGLPADAGVLNLHLGARVPEAGKTKIFFANPWAMAFTNQAGSGKAYVVSSGSDLLVKLNVDSGGVLAFTGGVSTTKYIDLADPNHSNTSGANAGKNPLGIVIRSISPSNSNAYVMNYVSRNVSVVNLTNDTVWHVIQTADLPLPGSQDEQLQVGKQIFFSSRGHLDHPNGTTVGTDIRLSSDGWQNCASCHFDALTDGVIWRFNSGPRKSIPLNATWSPQNPNDQRILNYSAIFDEVQDFELNIRNVSGPGPKSAGPPPVLDPEHGLIADDNGSLNTAPGVVNAFAKPNAGRPQFAVTLPGSSTAWPALDAVKEWIRFNIRTPNGELTTNELLALPGGNSTGGLNAADVASGRSLFFRAGCQTCHGGTKWSVSHKDFVTPPAATEIATENVATAPTANTGQYLKRFLSDIGSYNLNVPGGSNILSGQLAIGGVEKDTAGKDALGKDLDGDGVGNGFNIPSLLGIWAVQPYYHNGACETLQCVLADPVHRKKGQSSGDVLASTANQLKLVTFLKPLDADTEFPFDLSIAHHDISVSPPAAIKGTKIVIGANVSLFGVKSDLTALGDALGIDHVVVHFQVDKLNLSKDVDLPFTAFRQDFGQAEVTTTVTIPANLSGFLGNIVVTVDPGQVIQESSENNNTATRQVFFNSPPPDTTPPQVISTAISDDNPFNDKDFTVATGNVNVKFVVKDPTGNGTPSGVKQFCLVTYYYNYVAGVWIPAPCFFTPLPAAQSGKPDTFIVPAHLLNLGGLAYVFVWVRDGAGNISLHPGFDFVSIVPSGFVSLNRNDVLILRFILNVGENLEIKSLLQSGGSGDVDMAVFEDFTDPDATRVDVSANNGLTNETVHANGPGNFQVEIRAVVNSTFKITVTPTADAASAKPAEVLAGGTGISISGPPALDSAIGEPTQIFMPSALNEK